MMFTTRDMDQDTDGFGNCAEQWRGGWWYNRCYEANINGLNYNSPTTTPKGITWQHGGARGDGYNTWKGAAMKIRKLN